jgi:hypothetical protein
LTLLIGKTSGQRSHNKHVGQAAIALTLLAQAAAAGAAGDERSARELRLRAQALALALARQSPTDYGDARGALGPALLDGALVPCTE